MGYDSDRDGLASCHEEFGQLYKELTPVLHRLKKKVKVECECPRIGRTAQMEQRRCQVGTGTEVAVMEKCSVYTDCEQEAQRFKWIESEKAGCDLGETAIRRWVQNHWWGYLRARWLEHLQGKRFWVELDRGDFGLLQRKFHDNTILLDRILDRLKAGQENLDIIVWSQNWGISPQAVLQILEALDINSRRLAHRFDPHS